MVPTFQRNLPPYDSLSPTLKMKAGDSAITLVPTYHSEGCSN